MTTRRSGRTCGARGFTLLEVLVAILIFSFGLLGFAGLQARAIQFSVSAEDTNRAALFANELASVMVAKQNVDPASTALASAYTAWYSRVTATPANGGLPNVTASVSINSTSMATITITWRATSMAASATNATNQYVTQVVLP